MSESNKDKAHGRDYRKEYDHYQGSAAQKKRRAQRNKARREAEADGRARKGDGRDVGHKRALSKGGSNDKKNTAMQSRTANRSFSRNSDGSMKRERSRKGK